MGIERASIIRVKLSDFPLMICQAENYDVD